MLEQQAPGCAVVKKSRSKNKKMLSEADTTQIVGGLGHVQDAHLPHLSDSVVHEQPKFARAPAAPGTTLRPVDAFVPSSPAHRKVQESLEKIGESVSVLMREQRTPPTPKDIGVQMKSLEGAGKDLAIQAAAVRQHPALDEKHKQVLLQQIRNIEVRTKLATSALQRRQGQLDALARMEKLAASFSSRPQETAKELRALLPGLTPDQMDRLAPAEREQLNRARRALLDDLNKASKASAGPAPEFDAVLEALHKVAVPLGRDGAGLRVDQAKFMIGAAQIGSQLALLEKFQKELVQLTEMRAATQADGNAAVATKTENAIVAKKEEIARVAEQLKSLADRSTKDVEAAPNQAKALQNITRLKIKWFESLSGKQSESTQATLKLAADFGFDVKKYVESLAVSDAGIVRSYGLEPVNSQVLERPTRAQLNKMLLDAAEQKESSIHIVLVPEHAMLIAVDPATRTYHFFDPNSGLYRLPNQYEFAEYVSDHIRGRYDYAHPPGSDVLRIYRTLEVGQVAEATSQHALSKGVCYAMSVHMARWLFEHPGYDGPLSAEAMGLGDFNVQKRLAESAERNMRSQYYEKALAEYEMIAQSQDHRSAVFPFIAFAKHGIVFSQDAEFARFVDAFRANRFSEVQLILAERLKRDPGDIGLLALKGIVECKIAIAQLSPEAKKKQEARIQRAQDDAKEAAKSRAEKATRGEVFHVGLIQLRPTQG